MKKIHRAAWFAAVLALALCLPVPATASDSGATGLDWQPPGFEITDVEGAVFAYPDDLEGPTIVLFWATWCPYCRALMPHLQSVLDEYGDAVRVVALNFKDDGDPAGYIGSLGFDFRLILESGAVAASWGVKGTPGLFLADRTGRVVFSRGAIPAAAYGDDPERYESLKHAQKAARRAPFWAARLRESLDRLLRD